LAECLEERYKKYPAKLDYLCASAVLHHLTGDIKKSEETWNTLYAAAEKNGIEPEPEAVTYHICFEFHDMGRREKAIAGLKTALSRYPENVSICLTAVNLFAKLNMVSEVEDAARRLPESFEKYCHLIHTALYEERVADALAFGDKIIQKYPAAVRTGEKASVFWSAYLHAAFALGKSHLGI